VIIDTNRLPDYVKGNDEALKLLRNRIEKNKIKLIAPQGVFLAEYNKFDKFKPLISQYLKNDWFKKVSTERFSAAEADLKNKKEQGEISIRSNEKDLPILALARASDTELLVSDDRNLGEDFKNPKIIRRGRIIRTTTSHKDVKDLLDSNNCPS